MQGWIMPKTTVRLTRCEGPWRTTYTPTAACRPPEGSLEQRILMTKRVPQGRERQGRACVQRKCAGAGKRASRAAFAAHSSSSAHGTAPALPAGSSYPPQGLQASHAAQPSAGAQPTWPPLPCSLLEGLRMHRSHTSQAQRTGDVAREHILAVHEHAAPPGRRQAVHQALAGHLARHPRPERRPPPAHSLNG